MADIFLTFRDIPTYVMETIKTIPKITYYTVADGIPVIAVFCIGATTVSLAALTLYDNDEKKEETNFLSNLPYFNKPETETESNNEKEKDDDEFEDNNKYDDETRNEDGNEYYGNNNNNSNEYDNPEPQTKTGGKIKTKSKNRKSHKSKKNHK